jgi:transposase
VKCKLRENQELITQQQNSCDRFILATNILDTIELESEEILKIYKEQQSTERGFRFIKDPLFFADSLFVKNPETVNQLYQFLKIKYRSAKLPDLSFKWIKSL